MARLDAHFLRVPFCFKQFDGRNDPRFIIKSARTHPTHGQSQRSNRKLVLRLGLYTQLEVITFYFKVFFALLMRSV